MNEVWCSDAFAPKNVLKNVLLQGHYLLESDDGITIKIYFWAVSGPGTALYCAYIQEQGCDIIMLYHSSQFEIAILSHTSLAEGISEGFKASLMKRSTRGQDMCTVADASSYIHSVWHHWVIKAVGKVSPIKLLQKTEALQNILSKLEDT